MPQCRVCSASIPTADVNIAEGVAWCRGCNAVWRLGDLASSEDDSKADLAATKDPPRGCRVSRTADAMQLEAACFQPSALFVLAFGLGWLGFTGAIWLGAWLEFFRSLAAKPDLSGGVERATSATSNIHWSALPIGLFLTVFVAVGTFMVSLGLVSVFGTCRARLTADSTTISTGLGPIRLRRTLPSAILARATIDHDRSSVQILIPAPRPLKFGGMLRDDRRAWLLGMLRRSSRSAT